MYVSIITEFCHAVNQKVEEPLLIYVYPGERLHKGLNGHYFLDHPPQVRDRSLLHAPGLDQRPSVLSSSQSPSGLGNLNSFA